MDGPSVCSRHGTTRRTPGSRAAGGAPGIAAASEDETRAADAGGSPGKPSRMKGRGGMDGRACFDCTESEGGRGALGKGRRGTRSGRESPAGVLAWRVSRLDPVFAQLVACTPPDSRGQGICRSVTCATASVLKRDTSSGQFSNLNDLQYYF
jgi:hypothetical protein